MNPRQLKFLRFLTAGTLVGAVVACGADSPTNPTSGSIRIETTTGGSDLDPDGYTVAVDQSQATAIGLSAHLVFNDLKLGSHLVALADLATNCTTGAGAGANTRSIDVVGGDTVTVAFTVTCVAVVPPGGGGGGGGNPLRGRTEPTNR